MGYTNKTKKPIIHGKQNITPSIASLFLLLLSDDIAIN